MGGAVVAGDRNRIIAKHFQKRFQLSRKSVSNGVSGKNQRGSSNTRSCCMNNRAVQKAGPLKVPDDTLRKVLGIT